jgi:hypothetical protein
MRLHKFTFEEGQLADETLGITLSRCQYSNTFHLLHRG